MDVSPLLLFTMGTSPTIDEFVDTTYLYFDLFKWLLCFLSVIKMFQVCHYHYYAHTFLLFKVQVLLQSFLWMQHGRRSSWLSMLPITFYVVLRYVCKTMIKSVFQQLLDNNLIPISHKIRRQRLHACRLPRRHGGFTRLCRLIVSLYFCGEILHQGLTVSWFSPVVPVYALQESTHYRRRSYQRHGRYRLHQALRAREAAILKAYYSSLRTSKGWESLPDRNLPTDFFLQAKSVLLSRLYSRFIATVPLSIHRLPSIDFCRETFSPATSFLPNGLPDMSDLFKSITPCKPMAYQTVSQMYDACHLQSRAETQFSICFDTGCSLASTFSIDDFEEPPVKGHFGQLRTINGIVPIDAAGIIKWTVSDVNGNDAIIRVPGYYIPSLSQRLFSPQNYATYHQWGNPEADCYGGNDHWFWMKVASAEKGETQEVRMPISVLDGLPYLQGFLPTESLTAFSCHSCSSKSSTCESCAHAYNLSILDPTNENLTSAQKALLLDHFRLGHLGIDHLRTLYRCSSSTDQDCISCLVSKHPQVTNCSVPLCLACRIAKARKNPTRASIMKPSDRQHVLTQDVLQAGEKVFVDQYESNIRGRLPTSRGLESPHTKYCGGTLFFDAATQYIQIYHQTSLGSADTLASKQRFESEAAHCGVSIEHYHTDNGIFTKTQFRDALTQADQKHTISGVGAHHQNGAAERAIKTIQDMTRSMMIHMSVHWTDEYHVDLWPFAMEYAVWLYNHTPQQSSGLAPMELFCGTKLNCEYLRRAKVFGCPVYVLDPKLQDGTKIPKWSPRARLGQFLGFSKLHSSSVGLIRNLRTNHVSAQFHVVYDQLFSTVYGGLQARKETDFTADELQIFLKSNWDSDDRIYTLDEWDTAVDGPLPDKAPDWDAGELLPQPTPP